MNNMSNWPGPFPFMFNQRDQSGFPRSGGGATNLFQQMSGSAPVSGMISSGAFSMPGVNMASSRLPYMGLPQTTNQPFIPYPGNAYNLGSQAQVGHCPTPQRHSMPAQAQPSPTYQRSNTTTSKQQPVDQHRAAVQKPVGSPGISNSHVDIASKRGMFGWTTIDSVSIPYIIRDGKQYVSVRIVELKLLSKFPNNYPEEAMQNGPLSSEFVTANEAKLLNEINHTHCASEYGQELFNSKDLIVTVEDFRRFYGIIKKNFPHQTSSGIPTEGGPATSPLGGWLQINNTVVPYVSRNLQKFVPLSVVRYAAGLLTDVPVKGVEPTPRECVYLNQSCKDVDVDFTFNSSTKFVSVQMLESIKTEKIAIKELPKQDPFGHAEYTAEEEKNNESVSPAQPFGGQPGKSHANDQINMPPNVSISSNAVVGNHHHLLPSYGETPQQWHGMGVPCSLPGMIPPASGIFMNRLPQTVHPSQSGGMMTGQENTSINALQHFVASNTQARLPTAHLYVPQTSQRVPTPKGMGRPAMPTSQQHAMPPMQQQHLRADPQFMAPGVGNIAGQTRPIAQLKTVSKGGSVNHDQTQIQGCSDRITSVTVDGKVVSCISKSGVRYSLLEALGRVYFPDCAPADFQNVLESALKLKLVALEPEEELAFIQLYRLPVARLKCNKVVDVKDFEKLLPQLRYILEGKEIDSSKKQNETDSPNNQESRSVSQNQPRGGLDSLSHKTMAGLEELKNYITRKRQAEQSLEKPAKSRRLEDTVNRLKQTNMLDASSTAVRECPRVPPGVVSTDSARNDLMMQSSRFSDAQDRSETPASATSARSNSNTTTGHTSPANLPENLPESLKVEPSVDNTPSDNGPLRIDRTADGNIIITLDE